MQAKRSLTNSLIAVITGAFLLGNGLNVFGTQYIAALYPRLTDNFALFYGGQYINGYFPAPVPIRSYPSLAGENGSHVLGYVGSVTEQDLANTSETYYRNETIGKAGLE